MSTVSRGFQADGAPPPTCRRASTWSRTSGPVGGTNPQHRAGGLGVHHHQRNRRAAALGLGRLPGAAGEPLTVDIHCVTHWSKLHTTWEGVSLDTAEVETSASFALVSSYGNCSTNLPLEDLTDHKAWIAFRYDGQELEPEHGGPARLLVPYLWKSAKWVAGSSCWTRTSRASGRASATTTATPGRSNGSGATERSGHDQLESVDRRQRAGSSKTSSGSISRPPVAWRVWAHRAHGRGAGVRPRLTAVRGATRYCCGAGTRPRPPGWTCAASYLQLAIPDQT